MTTVEERRELSDEKLKGLASLPYAGLYAYGYFCKLAIYELIQRRSTSSLGQDAEIAAQLRKLLNAYPLGTMDWPLDVMRDAAAALERRLWQPMENAPKDGTFILAAYSSGHRNIVQWATFERCWRTSVDSTTKWSPNRWMSVPHA